MEFLYKLYSNDFFGIGLFMVITVLAFAFLIILFFGKRDEKARNAEKEINNEIENQTLQVENLQSESLEPSVDPSLINDSINTPVLEEIENREEIRNDISDTESYASNDINIDFDLDSKLINGDKTDSSYFEEEKPIVSHSFSNFDDSYEIEKTNDIDIDNDYITDNSFNIEENFDNKINENESLKEEFPKREQRSFNRPIIEEPEENNIFSNYEEESKSSLMSNQFSSVYLSNENNDQNQVQDNVQEEEEISPIPLKTEFEMPKPFDLPKLNRESDSSSSNIINTSSGNNNIFKNFDNQDF